MPKNNRKSVSARDVRDDGDEAQYNLMDTIRIRTHKMLKSATHSIFKLTDEESLSNLNIWKSDLDLKWSDYYHAYEKQEAALVATGDEYRETITQEFISNHNSYLKAKMHAAALISDHSVARESSAFVSPSDDNRIRSDFKLPPIRITPFSGNSCNWIEFKATCNSVLTDRIPETQRLQYLKDALENEARQVVAYVLPGEGSYERAMHLLRNRYENTRTIVNSQLRIFYKIPCIERPNASAFRSILNTVNSLVAALNCCEVNTKTWDPIIIFHISMRFDRGTLSLWEEKMEGKREIPKLKVFLEFIEMRITVLETTEEFLSLERQEETPVRPVIKPHHNARFVSDQKRPSEKVRTFLTLKQSYQCVFCKKNHLPSRCSDIKNLSIKDCQSKIDNNNLCANCFYPHEVANCPFDPACKKCGKSHHTLLHPEGERMFLNLAESEACAKREANATDFNAVESDNEILSQISGQHFYHLSEAIEEETLLATAIVPTYHNGRSILAKLLIDQGSTANLITINACNLLNVRIARINAPMFGVGNTPVGKVVGLARVNIGSSYDKTYKLAIRAIVVRSIGDVKGFSKDHIAKWHHLHSLSSLADPSYYESHKIDLLLGGSAHADFISSGVVKGERHQPIAQQSKLGWIISGNTNVAKSCEILCRTTTFEQVDNRDNDLNRQLKEFWELEEVAHKRFTTPDEELAEKVFKESVRRADDGKFIVDLPFKMNPIDYIGESFPLAMRCYKSLQKRLDKNPELKTQYDGCFEEYLTLGHMELVDSQTGVKCFLPHHAVIKPSSSSTKVRAVLNASAKTSTGFSLNDCLCVGPVIQPELFDLLISWRKFEFAISGDIEKMYRMMYVNANHANYQCILWQRPGSNEIAAYRLLTVTFGTSSAPFQATRGVYEIGERIKESNPQLSDMIQTSFYVDDFLKSFSTIESAKAARLLITETLDEFGFKLRKWKSNDVRILENVDDANCEASMDFDSTFKTLGIAWQSNSDMFVFKSLDKHEAKIWTKRSILSVIAKIFDPLGWLAPTIVRAKILLQEIWRLPNGSTWDSALPEYITKQWLLIFSDLTSPVPIEVPRWLKMSGRNEKLEIHAFCDASNLAYACCVYLRVIRDDHLTFCNLIAAKTKVAPVKTTTIPRLELCGATLLAKLVTRCIRAMSLDDCQIFAWCDSKIVLAWIATHPSKWVTFVANRVSEIQQSVDAGLWRHIATKQNPADIASRGSSVQELKKSTLWWHGPSFLSSSSAPSPNQNVKLPIDSAPEKRKCVKIHQITAPKENRVLSWFSEYDKLLRFTCRVIRWLNKTRKHSVSTIPIDAKEIENAEKRWIKLVQREHFGHEMGRLVSKSGLPKTSSLFALNPFVDDEGFLRMNGRVKNADLLQQKTSIILPANSCLVTLIIGEAHEQTALHGGVQLTLRALRERFWILHARNQVKKLVGKCVLCFRRKTKLLTQQMAELPSFRTQQAKPFTFVGCDYAGYFEIKTSERKNAPTTKAYIALFICLTTKALHLELVCDLSTAEFIMALENFIARRGIPNVLYTDNATNFIGAEREINVLHDQMLSQENEVTRMLAHNRITFRHTPARASHMAGIWERSVGLVKYHLKRVMTNTKMTARKFDYVLKQIECCLNSRPLWAITPNSDDIEVITPSHFFNFQAINTLPRPDLTHIQMNRLSQYQYLYRLYTDFWKGWSKEYLDQLQPRSKWGNKQPNACVGQIVVISEENIPPSRWPIGKITAVYPARDGLIRTVDVLCKGSTLKRPIHRLGMLPIIDNETLNDSRREQFNGGEHVGDFSSLQ